MQIPSLIRVPLATAALFGVALLCLGLAPAARAAVAWQPPVKLTGVESTAPRIAVDAAGDATAVWTETEGGKETVMSADRQAGGTWTAPVAISATVEVQSKVGFRPRIAVDPQGDTVVIWEIVTGPEVEEAPGTFRIPAQVQAVRRPAGGGWSAPQTISAPSLYLTNVAVAIADSGEAVAAWALVRKAGEVGEEAVEDVVQGATLSPAGTWSSPTDVSAPTESPSSVAVATDATGAATLIWLSGLESGGPGEASEAEISAAERTAQGGFGSPFTLGSSGSNFAIPTIDYNLRGDAVVAWVREEPTDHRRFVESASRAAGGPWGGPEIVTPTATDVIAPHVVIDEAGAATAVWTNRGSGMPVIEGADRPAGGGWSTAVRLSAEGQRADEADLAVDAAGDTVASWKDARPGFEGVQASIRPTGMSWGAPIDLSEAAVMADSPEVAIADANHAVTVWEGASQAGGRIEASAYEDSPSGPQPEAPVQPGTVPPSAVGKNPTPPAASGGIGLLKVSRRAARGVGALTLSVPRAGTVSISGAGVRALTLRADGAGVVIARLVPRGAYRRKLAARRRAFTTVHVVFVGDDGTRLEFDRRVRLVDRTDAPRKR